MDRRCSPRNALKMSARIIANVTAEINAQHRLSILTNRPALPLAGSTLCVSVGGLAVRGRYRPPHGHQRLHRLIGGLTPAKFATPSAAATTQAFVAQRVSKTGAPQQNQACEGTVPSFAHQRHGVGRLSWLPKSARQSTLQESVPDRY